MLIPIKCFVPSETVLNFLFKVGGLNLHPKYLGVDLLPFLPLGTQWGLVVQILNLYFHVYLLFSPSAPESLIKLIFYLLGLSYLFFHLF